MSIKKEEGKIKKMTLPIAHSPGFAHCSTESPALPLEPLCNELSINYPNLLANK